MASLRDKAGIAFTSNIPNLLSVSRIILAFVVIYLIFTRASLVITVIIFCIAAFTDFLDGQLARRFRWESEFGRKADMIADRFLWAGTALAFIISYGMEGVLTWREGVQLLLFMARELITLPFAFIAFFSGNVLPHARDVAKVTTLLQGFGLPALILSLAYPLWGFVSWPLAIACAVTGFISAMYYIHDVKKEDGEKQRPSRRRK